MHSKMMRFLVDCSAVVGVILALLIAWLVGGAVDNAGIGLIVFIITLIIVEMGLASEGMKVEQAENLAKIAYNTEQLVKMQEGGRSNGGYSTISYNPPVNTSDSQAVLSKSWTCQSCSEINASNALFCKNCGVKKMY